MKTFEVLLKRRSLFQRLIRITKMIYKSNKLLKGAPVIDRIKFLYGCVKIVLK